MAFPLVVGIGLASMLMINTINVTIQNAVPDALRGRVMALYVTVFAGSAPIGGLVAGSLAQAFGAPVAFSVGAALAASCSRWWPGSCARTPLRGRQRIVPERPALEVERAGGMTPARRVVSMSNFPEA